MRRLLLFLLLLLPALALGQTYVNSGKCTGGSFSCTITLSATSGNTVIVGAATLSGTAVTFTVTDTNGDTFTAITGGGVTNSNGGGGQHLVAYKTTFGTTNASEVITVTASSQNLYMGGLAAQYSSVGSVDQVAISNVTTQQTSWTTQNTPTTTQASEMLVGMFMEGSASIGFTAGSGYTSRQTSTSTVGLVLEDQAVSSTGAYAATATPTGGGQYYAGVIVTLAPPAGDATISPASGSYLLQQSITISGAGCGNIYYTTDGSTPTSGSTLYSGAFNSVSSGSETVKALCSADGHVATNTYTIPADVAIASSDFSDVYDANLAPNHVQQFPLDTTTTQGKWKSVGGISGDLGVSDQPSGAIAPVRAAVAAAVTSGYAVGGYSGRQLAAYTGRTGFANDQYAAGKLPSGGTGYGGVAVRCATDGTKTCYYFYGIPGSGSAYLELGKIVGGTQTTIASSTGQTVSAGATIKLRVLGTQLQPLIAGAQPPGFGAATYTDSAIASGACGVVANNGYVSDFSCGNVGTSDGTSVNSYTPTNPTYTDSFGSGSWAFGWPWFQAAIPVTSNSGSNHWAGPFSAQLISGSTYGLGLALNQEATISYRGGEFGASQWQRYKIDVNANDPSYNHWFAPLQHQTWVPGTTGGCGGSNQCYDSVSYYPGVAMWQKYRNAHSGVPPCSGAVKDEYCATPYLHITKVTPTASPDDSVNTVAGSLYTPRPGDELFEEYVGTSLNVACKGVASQYVYWQANHSYAAGSYIIDSLGNWQYTASGGTSGATQPPTTGTGSWGATWDTVTSYNGAATTDNTVTWEYMGQPCPTTTKFSWVIQATDSDLVGAKGIPALFESAYIPSGSNTPQPVFYGWSAGTATTNTACTLDANLCTTLEQPHPWMAMVRKFEIGGALVSMNRR